MASRALLLVALLPPLVACTPSLPHGERRGSSSSSATAGGSGGATPGGVGGGWPSLGGSVPGSGGAGGGGGAGGVAASSAAAGGRASGSSVASSASSSTSGGAVACTSDHLLLAEVRSRGLGGAADEFVALYNPTAAPVTLDTSWSIEVRGATDTTYRAHWTGSGGTIPARGHFLVSGSAYAETPAPDAHLTTAIPDAASLRLQHGGATVDAVCFAYDATSQSAYDATFTCAGRPADNRPHDNKASSTSDVDASLARRPGGNAGNCADSGDNATDFMKQAPATPASSASPTVP